MMEQSVAGSGPVKVLSATAEQMFLDLPADAREKLPRYQGDLLLTEHSAGSLTSQARPCGGNASNVDAATYYCPEGVGAPLRVGVGNYSVGSGLDAPHVRTGQAVCPQGSYCVMGLQVCE